MQNTIYAGRGRGQRSRLILSMRIINFLNQLGYSRTRPGCLMTCHVLLGAFGLSRWNTERSMMVILDGRRASYLTYLLKVNVKLEPHSYPSVRMDQKFVTFAYLRTTVYLS